MNTCQSLIFKDRRIIDWTCCQVLSMVSLLPYQLLSLVPCMALVLLSIYFKKGALGSVLQLANNVQKCIKGSSQKETLKSRELPFCCVTHSALKVTELTHEMQMG
jgi:hypothetical protein